MADDKPRGKSASGKPGGAKPRRKRKRGGTVHLGGTSQSAFASASMSTSAPSADKSARKRRQQPSEGDEPEDTRGQRKED
jgi:hypothetical protein